jgi:DNA-binding MarR family transcriptional regulator
MTAIASRRVAVDLSEPDERKLALRIGNAWIDLRRGSGTTGIRDYMFGPGNLLEQGQMDALDLLINREHRTMSSLAGRLRVNPSTATRAVDRLVSGGLVERFHSPDDGRVVLVRITEEGRRCHAQVAARRAHVMSTILGAFTAAERVVLAGLLERLVESIDEVAGEVNSAAG